MTPGCEESGGTLGQDGRRTEGSGHDEVSTTSQVVIMGEVLRSPATNAHVIFHAELGDRLLQEGTAADRPVDQEQRCRWPASSEHEARESTTRAEIDDLGRSSGEHQLRRFCEGRSVSDLRPDVSGPQEAQRSAPRQDGLDPIIEG